MLIPVVGALLFVFFSGIGAIMTIQDIKVPKNINKLSLKVDNYSIQKINPQTQNLNWELHSDIANVNKTNGFISLDVVTVYFYDQIINQVKFIINAKTASLNSHTKNLDRCSEVKLDFVDDSFHLQAQKLLYSEKLDNFEMLDQWTLQKQSKFQLSAERGTINSSFSQIHARQNARLLDFASNTVLTADSIYIRNEKVTANSNVMLVTSKATIKSSEMLTFTNEEQKQYIEFSGRPSLIQNGQEIFADTILFYPEDEELVIKGHVRSD